MGSPECKNQFRPKSVSPQTLLDNLKSRGSLSSEELLRVQSITQKYREAREARGESGKGLSSDQQLDQAMAEVTVYFERLKKILD